MKLQLAALALVAILAVAGFSAYRAWAAPARESVSETVLEEKYGVRIRLVAVTADGGMVDFRYKVLDQNKAMALFGDHKQMPAVIDLDSGVTLQMPAGMEHESTLQTGRIYIHHFLNGGGAVKMGDKVAVSFGKVQVEPVVAR